MASFLHTKSGRDIHVLFNLIKWKEVTIMEKILSQTIATEKRHALRRIEHFEKANIDTLQQNLEVLAGKCPIAYEYGRMLGYVDALRDVLRMIQHHSRMNGTKQQ